MSTCQHTTTTSGPDYAYMAPVAVEPYTTANPVAHGNVTYTETCVRCGSERAVNANAGQIEVSPWGPDRATQEATARQIAEAARQAQEQQDRAAALALETRILSVRDDEVYLTTRPAPQARWYRIDDLEAAARQQDTGDGLVQAYAGILHLIADARCAVEAR